MSLCDKDVPIYFLIVLQLQSEFILRIEQEKMFPFIFTISILFIIIAFFTSKLQNESTNLLISIYSALGPAQTAAITLTIIVFINNGHEETIIKILLFASLGIILLVNLMGYIVQTPFLLKDRRFLKWANRITRRQESRSNLIWFHVISLLSFFSSYKLKMILFSRLFNFECFKFQLQNISKFKVFNVFSFIGFFPQILSLYCCISVIAYSTLTMEQLIIFIDLLIIIVMNMIFSLLIIKKDENFFTETSGGLPMNRIFNLIEEMSSSSHIINQRQRQGQQKKRVQLEDISEYDEYAYTSTKRERNVKLVGLKNKRKKEQDSYYFQETESENTGSKINSEISNEQMQVVNTHIAQNENQSKKMQQNILNIDDFYQDQSNDGVKQRQQQMLNQPISNQQPLSLEQTPQIIQEIRQNKPKNINNSSNPKDTHTKLSDYLLSVQKQHEQKIKDNSEDTNFKNIDKQIDSDAETQRNKQKFLILINQSALIDSQPSIIPNDLTPHRHENFYQQTIDNAKQQAAKKIIQKVVSAHNSPKKIIQQEQDKKPQKFNFLSSSIKINDQHDQRPIKNKSIEKAKKQENHPINTPINTHPIFGHKASKQSQDDESDITQLKDRRVKVQQQKLIPEKIQTIQTPLQPNQIQKSQQFEPQVPRPKFYQQFIQQEEQSNNSFKRNHPQSLALFSKNNKHKSIIVDNSIGNNNPRKPMQYSQNQFQSNSDWNNKSQFVLKRNFDKAIKFSTNKPRERPMTSKQGRFHKFSLQKKSIKGLQGKKMLSLEKIYLQRLSNF